MESGESAVSSNLPGTAHGAGEALGARCDFLDVFLLLLSKIAVLAVPAASLLSGSVVAVRQELGNCVFQFVGVWFILRYYQIWLRCESLCDP